ncbi:hypothetical protein ANO11243_041570 [Dothideomycetidae sp. 11243]|nr:hypothetical protein ANO11243_041570 [fungal sp. No.11243]
MTSLYVGRRLSLKGDLCTVRYLGQVDGKQGQWLGVEWDEPGRGKHDGNVEGKSYFTCRSKKPQCASFLRCDAKFDAAKTTSQAVTAKYASSDHVASMPMVRISGKTVEETGYDKIVVRQSQLGSLKNVVLDAQLLGPEKNEEILPLSTLCPQAALVDLSFNLFERFDDICHTLGDLVNLRAFSFKGNRLHAFESEKSFRNITSLNLDHMLLSPEQLQSLLIAFPCLKQLSVSTNLLSLPSVCYLPRTLQEISLNDNGFTDLTILVPWLSSCDVLAKIGLKNNQIANITSQETTHDHAQFPRCVKEIDVSYNAISSWAFLDTITEFVPGLEQIRISGNPVYENTMRPGGKPLNQSEVSMIVIARVAGLKTLNFTTITDKDRLNAETFYLSLIGEEISKADPAEESSIVSRHPRYGVLCQEYGTPSIIRASKSSIDTSSIAAHLVSCHVYFSQELNSVALPSKREPQLVQIPQSFSIYNVYGHIGRRFGMLPSSLRLVWETGERDPPDRGMGTHAAVIEEWDSEEEDDSVDKGDWIDREVELVRGTRPLGTVVETSVATIRIEFRQDVEDTLVSEFLAK